MRHMVYRSKVLISPRELGELIAELEMLLENDKVTAEDNIPVTGLLRETLNFFIDLKDSMEDERIRSTELSYLIRRIEKAKNLAELKYFLRESGTQGWLKKFLPGQARKALLLDWGNFLLSLKLERKGKIRKEIWGPQDFNDKRAQAIISAAKDKLRTFWKRG